MMEQHLHLVTLGVSDLERSRRFYQDVLGWQPSSASSGAIAFFQAGGIVLALFPRDQLAEDALVPPEGSSFPGFTLAHNVSSHAEVDAIISDLRGKGVHIAKKPQKMFWGGYSSYFSDPDGYLWEVAYNPDFPFDEAGNLTLP
jgi:catechol 2,3-dioxygenase-like lactoylglutathione lyase family enzyme